jgi:hypothetical protein
LLIRRLILLFLAAAALRVTWVGVRYGRQDAWSRLAYPDEEAYVLSARSLAGGRGLIDEFGYRATYMPGYPAFLSLFVQSDRGLLWARVLQAILAAWVAPATYLLARAFVTYTFSDSKDSKQNGLDVPLLAGALAAVDPFLVFFSGLLLTEALYAAVLVSAWVCLLRAARPNVPPHWIDVFGAGVFLLVAVLLRPAAWILVFSGAFLLCCVRRFDRRGFAAGATISAMVFVGLTPWAARNASVIGQWRWLTTRGGISLYDGVQGGTDGESNLAHTKALPAVRGLSETQWDAYFGQAAREEIRHNPVRVLHLAGSKLLRTWSPRPNVAEYRSSSAGWVSGAWMVLLLAGAACGWWHVRRSISAWVLLLWPVIATTALHMLFVASVRYRVPVMPMMMVLSAVGIVSWARWASPRAVPADASKSDMLDI